MAGVHLSDIKSSHMIPVGGMILMGGDLGDLFQYNNETYLRAGVTAPASLYPYVPAGLTGKVVTWASYAQGSASVNTIAYIGARHIRAYPGAHQYSTDNGVTWSVLTLPNSAQTRITVANGLAFAHGSANIASHQTSPDGVTWTTRSFSYAATWEDVAYGNGVYVAVESNNNAGGCSSTNGTSWTTRAFPGSKPWKAIAYGNGIFMAMAGVGSTATVTSPDGVTWTTRTPMVPVNKLVFGNGVFVTIPAVASASVHCTTDGITWSTVSLDSLFNYSGVQLSDITFADGVFIVIGHNGGNWLAVSTDGVNWTRRITGMVHSNNKLGYGNGYVLSAPAVSGTYMGRAPTQSYILNYPANALGYNQVSSSAVVSMLPYYMRVD